MRQPGRDTSSGIITGKVKQANKKKWFAVVLIVILAAGGIGYFSSRSQPNNNNINNSAPGTLAVDQSIAELKSSKALDDQRSLISDYELKQDYSQAEAIAKSVAQRTNSTQDYMTLLTLCAPNNVPDKQNCIDLAVAKLKPQINSLPFYQVYIVGSLLDQANDQKDAVVFYQRAYDIYPAQTDAYTKTKAQLKQRIDQLNA